MHLFRKRLAVSLVGTVLFATPWAATAQPPAADSIDFEREVRPLLRETCGSCHGAEEQKSSLRLDVRHAAMRGGDGGEVIVAGSADDSELIRRVESDDPYERMPPEGKPLTSDQIAMLRKWIDAGAVWPETEYDRQALHDPRRDHWSFQPVSAVSVPSLSHDAVQRVMSDWPSRQQRAHTPIDVFVVAKLHEQGLTMSPPADRRTLIRRLAFDLHGLPPTITEIEAFVNDARPDAWARLVDRMLASPRYAERWAQHWLDLVRYADTHGFEVNTPRENAWPYRDYVIQSFNDDLPYDQFLREQIAGDAYNQPAATGFLVAAAALLPGQIGADDASKRLARQDELDEIIIGTSATILGLTVGCARCHDHKFDPISQRDYYAMQAFFAGLEYGDRPLTQEPSANALESTAGSVLADRAVSGGGEVPNAGADDAEAAAEQDSGQAESEAEPVAMVFAAKSREPDETYFLRRGDPEQRVEPLSAAVPALFTEGPETSSTDGDSITRFIAELPDLGGATDQQRRMVLADWLTDPRHPLTARVMVNRIWLYHFGQGIVSTASDFGLNGVRPTHPELLDWLAAEFVRQRWSIKQLHRTILMSAVYRQSSELRTEAVEQDRGNRWLWRFPARRLEAEAIRDSMLSVSGELNLQAGGPGFNFFHSRGGLNGFPPLDKFGPAELRRMVFAHKVRMEPVPVFGAFDCPDAGQPTPQRSRSTTSLQALNLFNSSFTLDRAGAFAERIEQRVGADTAGTGTVSEQVRDAFRTALGREPSERELDAALPVVQQHGLSTLCRVLLNSNEFLFLP